MQQYIFYTVLVSMMLAIMLMPIFKKFAYKKNLLSRTNAMDRRKVPYIGGIVFYIVFCMVLMIMLNVSKMPFVIKKLQGIIISSAIIVILGLYDDWRELKMLPKFFGQLIAAMSLAIFGIRTHIILIGDLVNYIITIIWIVGIVNAFNFLDIRDGLCAGIALIATTSFFIIALITKNNYIAMQCAVLAGILIVFLKYNCPPAKLFMGDTGSMFLGFILAAIALEISYAPEGHSLRLLSPIMVMTVPIFDIIFVTFMRLKNKRSVFKKSNDHFIFLLEGTKFSRQNSIIFMFKLGILAALAAIIINLTVNITGSIVFVILLVTFIVSGAKISYLKNV
ncbi:MAG: MraY family glycosyltransferase [Candidatus Omnitrophota bacterium]